MTAKDASATAASAAADEQQADESINNTSLYPLLAVLDISGQQPSQQQQNGNAADSPPSFVSSPSSWLLSPHVLQSQLLPALQSAVNNAAASTAVQDVVIITRDEIEQGNTKKKGAPKETKKKKGEELSSEELYEQQNYSLSEIHVEALRDRVQQELQRMEEALENKRRAEAEAAEAAAAGVGGATMLDAKKTAKGKKAPASSGAAGKSTGSSTPTGASAAGSRGSAGKKNPSSSTSSSGKVSARSSRPSSPAPVLPSSAPAPAQVPLHFVLVDLVRTPGDAKRIQSIVGSSIDVYLRFFDESAANNEDKDTEAAAKEKKKLKTVDESEFLYGAPTGNTNEDEVEAARLEREQKADAMARATPLKPHPFDQGVYAEFKNGQLASNKSSSKAALSQQSLTSLQQSLVELTRTDPSFRHLVFLPVPLPQPTTPPELGTSLSAAALGRDGAALSASGSGAPAGTGTVSGSPPVSARGSMKSTTGSDLKAAVGSSGSGSGAAASSSGAASSTAKSTSKGKKGGAPTTADANAPLTAEQQLLAHFAQNVLLALREFSEARSDFQDWIGSTPGSPTKKVALPRASHPIMVTMPDGSRKAGVDTRLYSHLLSKVPAQTIDVNTMLFAMFEQVAVNAAEPQPAGSGSGAAAGGVHRPAKSSVDLDAYFAGESANELESWMESALERVTLGPASAAAAMTNGAAGSAAAPASSTYCWANLAGRHSFEISAANAGSDAVPTCSACGWSQQPGGWPSSGVNASSMLVPPFVRFGDELRRRRVESALELGIAFDENDPITRGAEELLREFYPIPGVNRRGMPNRLNEQQMEKLSVEYTNLIAHGTTHSDQGEPEDGSHPKLSPEVFERALLLLELEEMLLQTSPDFKFTQYAALDPSQQSEVEVEMHADPAASSASSSANGKLVPSSFPAPSIGRAREPRPGMSLYHIAHLRKSRNAVIESSVESRLRSLHEEAKRTALTQGSSARSGSGGTLTCSLDGFGFGFGFDDTSDAADSKWDWKLHARCYQDELNPRALAQRIVEAMRDPSGNVHTQVRYRPAMDELLVTIHASTPLTRQREKSWHSYMAPNLTLQQWLDSSVHIQRLRPSTIYSFLDGEYSGKLATKIQTFFPADAGTRMGVATFQSGEETDCVVLLEKDGIVVTMERVTVEWTDPVAIMEQRLQLLSNASTKPLSTGDKSGPTLHIELDECASIADSANGNSRPPSSSGLGSNTAAAANRRTSGKESVRKSPSPNPKGDRGSIGGASTSSTSVSPAPSSRKSATGNVVPSARKSGSGSGSGVAGSTTGGKTSRSKKAQQEAKEMEEELERQAAQAEADAEAAREAEAAAAAAAEAARLASISSSAVLLSALFPDGTRLTASPSVRVPSSSNDATPSSPSFAPSRVSYTTRSGLVVEVRGRAGEVLMKYPSSILDGDEMSPLMSGVRRETNKEKKDETDSKMKDTDTDQTIPEEKEKENDMLATALPPPSISTASESFRVVSASGAVYRQLIDGSTQVLHADGSVAFRAAGRREWIITDQCGKRFFSSTPDAAGASSTDALNHDLDPVPYSHQFDAESRSTVWTRSDLVVFIQYKDGSTLAQHADGTRIYADILEGDAPIAEEDTIGQSGSMDGEVSGAHSSIRRMQLLRRVTVEHPRFPPLIYTHLLRTELRSAEQMSANSSGVIREAVVDLKLAVENEDGFLLHKRADNDVIRLSKEHVGTRFLITPSNRVFFLSNNLEKHVLPRGFDSGAEAASIAEAACRLNNNDGVASSSSSSDLASSIPKLVYDFDLRLESGGALRVADMEDSIFYLNAVGTSKMVLGRERKLAANGAADSIPASYYPLPSGAAQPRCFIVRGDGSGAELLSDDAVRAFMKKVERDPRTTRLSSQELDNNGSRGGDSVSGPTSIKYVTKLDPLPPYQRHPVIPNVIRAAPNGLAAGSSLASLASEDPLVILRRSGSSSRGGQSLVGSSSQDVPRVLMRHLVYTPQISLHQLQAAHAARLAYQDWLDSQQREEDAYRIDEARQAAREDRDEEERAEEERVAREIEQARALLLQRKSAHHASLLAQEQIDVPLGATIESCNSGFTSSVTNSACT